MHLIRQYFLISFMLALVLTDGISQTRKDEDKDFQKEPSRIGWGLNLGNIRFYNRTFEFGLAPNVAYRISEPFAVGFMLKADYFFTKYEDFNGNLYKFSAFDFGPTVFARYKPLWNWDGATPFLQGLFLQAEYERAFLTRADPNEPLIPGQPVPKAHFQEDFLYVGLGAASGYPFSTFVSIHYNLLDEIDSLRFPFSYRLGFTYNY